MNLPLWFTIPVFLLWFIVPSVLSWWYDMKKGEYFRVLILYLTGRGGEAKSLLRQREDRTKPIRWFHWIPIIGRVAMHNRDMRMHPDLTRELKISLVENTMAYFIVGLFGARYGFWNIFGVINIIFMTLTPLEYKATLIAPRLFLSDGEIDYVEYVCVFFHAYCCILLGLLIGNLPGMVVR